MDIEGDTAQAVNGSALPDGGASDTNTNSNEESGADEQFARRMGWRPETEWSGPENRKPARFLDAGEYIKRVETEVPVLRERLRFYDDQLVKTTKKVEEFGGTIKEQGEALKELLTRTKTAEQRGYERAIADKQSEMRAAVASADTAAYARAEAEARAINDARVKAMQPPAPQQKPAAQPQVHPETTAWLAQNEWFNRDRVLNAAAIEAYEVVARDMPAASETQRLAETKRRVQAEFPHKFGANPRRDAPPSVNAPSGDRAAPKAGKSVRDLPDDARRELDRFKKLIPGFTDKDFLESYEW
jgi:gas vesicle protein